MSKTSHQTPEKLRQLHERVEQWRRTRKRLGPMPEELWQEAAKMAEEHSATKVAGYLGIGYVALKNRMGNQSQKKGESKAIRFVECRQRKTSKPAAGLNRPEAGPVCIEFTDLSGCSLKIQVPMSRDENFGVYLRQVWELRECFK